MADALAVATTPEQTDAPGPSEDTPCVWVMRRHVRVTLREAHAIVEVDHVRGAARALCGLELGPREIDDVPSGGCMPCVSCVARIPLPR